MRRLRHLVHAATLGVLLGAAACENEQLMRPTAFVPIAPLFRSYVSMGNSITAGFQSGGINEATQRESYAVLLAGQMRTPFFIPAMNMPGCPSLYTNVFTQTRVAPTVPCALRVTDAIPSPYISNVAVPGAEVMDALRNLDTASNANALTTFFLGGRTQWQMMLRSRPTFISVWIGNNDVLGAATNATDAGNPALVTPPATFATRYGEMMDSVDRVGAMGGVLIGVGNVTALPYFSLGSTYWYIDNGLVPGQTFDPAPFTVGPNCAPATFGGNGDQILVPFPFGGALLATAAGGTPTTLDCTEPQTIQPAELANLTDAVTAYNATIQAEAAARAWLYFNPNPALDSLRAAGDVASFPAFGAPCSANPFGVAFSCDGVHPSALTHRLLANKLIQEINRTSGTNLQTISP